MRYRNILPIALAVLLAMTYAAFSQGPVGDEVMVTFDRAVQVGSHTLPPGDYTIRQVTSASNPRVLEFTSDNGTKLDATVTAIPILQNTPPSATKVDLEDEGGGARLARIWVQGKTYGYEFPGTTTPAAPVNLEAQFTPAAPAVVAEAQPAEVPPPAPVAETPAPAPVPAPAPEAQPAPAEIAQNRPPEPAPQAPAAAPTPAPPEPATPEVPATALGWAQLALAGLMIATTGLAIYWRDCKKTR